MDHAEQGQQLRPGATAARRDAQIAYMVAVDRMIRAAEEAKRERDRLLEMVRADSAQEASR